MKTMKPEITCGDCIHYFACSAWNAGSLMDTDAHGCANFQKGEQIHAHWIEVNCGTIAQCSNCFDILDVTDTKSTKVAHEAFKNFCILYGYCPNCGAKMDERVEK